MFEEMRSGFASEKNTWDLLETGTKVKTKFCFWSTMFTSWPLKQDTVSAVLRGSGIIVCAFF